MIRDSGQHVPQITFGIDFVLFYCTEQTVNRSRTFSTTIGARKRKFFLPRATTRNARSAALLSISMRPSSQKRRSAPHRPSAISKGFFLKPEGSKRLVKTVWTN
jgi:hypothetical protein